MGIRFFCPNGHKLNVKEHLAGKRGVCPQCGAKFTIPLPTDLHAPDNSHPAGQSQSIEIAASPPPNLSPTNSADVPPAIVPVTEADLAPPDVLPQASAPTPADALPASILGVLSSLPPAPADASPDANYPLPRASNRRNQILVSLLLLALVLVLAVVLIWVLKREGSPAPAEEEKKAAMDTAPPCPWPTHFRSITA
jgi:hypothetical protein